MSGSPSTAPYVQKDRRFDDQRSRVAVPSADHLSTRRAGLIEIPGHPVEVATINHVSEVARPHFAAEFEGVRRKMASGAAATFRPTAGLPVKKDVVDWQLQQTVGELR